MGEAIRLGSSSSNRSNTPFSSTSTTTQTEAIRLGTTSSKGQTIGQQISRARTIPVISALFTPTALAITTGTATALATGNPIAGLVTALTTPIVTEALVSSPTLDKAVTTRITDPAKVGTAIGNLVEDPKKTIGEVLSNVEEKIKETTSGVVQVVKENPITSTIIGAGAIAGAGAIVKNVIDKTKETGTSISNAIGNANQPNISAIQPVANPPYALQMPTTTTEKPLSNDKPTIKVNVKPNIINRITINNQNKKYLKRLYFC